jgi:hypothetical protein
LSDTIEDFETHSRHHDKKMNNEKKARPKTSTFIARVNVLKDYGQEDHDSLQFFAPCLLASCCCWCWRSTELSTASSQQHKIAPM